MSENERVLRLLKMRGREGITCKDFGRGYRLGARIYEWRKAGLSIDTITEPNLGKRGHHARYVLSA